LNREPEVPTAKYCSVDPIASEAELTKKRLSPPLKLDVQFEDEAKPFYQVELEFSNNTVSSLHCRFI
jgi:hypothetical protein